MSTDRYTCEHDGCTKGRGTGHALYRTSPKGDLFRGACTDHHSDFHDHADRVVTQAVEDRNQQMRAEDSDVRRHEERDL